MKLRKIALVVGMGSLVACAMSRRDGGQSPTPTQAPPASPATSPDVTAKLDAMIAGYRAALTKGFTTDFTTSRIVGDANTPDYRVQAYLKSLEPRPEITCNDTQSFNVATGGAIHTTPATYSSWTGCAITDIVALAMDSTSSTRGIASTSVSPNDGSAAASGLIVLTDLHTGGLPQLQSYAPTSLLPSTQTFNLGGVIFNTSGSRVYALSAQGNLYCFNIPATTTPATAMTACGSGWPVAAATAGVTYSTPFPTYAGNGEIEHIYFGDDGDHLNCIQGMAATSPGTTCWTAPQLVSGGGAQVGPVVVNIDSTTAYETVYAGDSGGRFFRVTNNGSAPTVGGTIEEADLYSIVSASYSATTWPVHGSPTIDFTSSNAYVTAAGYMFQFPLTKESNGGSWGGGVTTFKNLNLIQTASSTVDGSTSLDHTNGYAYVGYAGYLFKAAYPFDGNTSDKTYGTPLSQTVSGSPNYPIGYPLPYGPYSSIYIGTGTNSGTTGRMEAYTLNGTGAAPPLAGTTSTAYGDMIESGAVLDWANGNIYFGYDSGSGGIVQYPAGNPNPSSAWSCPSGDTLSGGACVAGCSGGPGAQGTCVNGSNVLSETCSASTNGVCSVATCAPNYADCDGLNANGCEVDYKTDPNNCGACAASGGTVCPTRNDVPACVNGACSVTCDDGYGICSPGNINVSGCPTTISCTSCCGSGPGGSNSCAGGSTCDDGTCTTATEHVCASESSSSTPVTVTCPSGLTIQAVSFASYGQPNGSCGSWSTNSSCDDSIPSTGDNNERSAVTTACYGQTSCSITPDSATFGTPTCTGGLRFAMQVECACPTILSLCANGYQDGTETDVDCGGAAETGCTNTGNVPSTCAVGKKCEADSDCASGDCECSGSTSNLENSGNCGGAGLLGVCGAGKGTFTAHNTTSTPQTFTVPSGCSTVFVQAWGAGGGGGRVSNATGGSGGYVNASFPVTATQVIDVWDGQGGSSVDTNGATGGGLGWANTSTTAYGGGGQDNSGGNHYAGGGGGLTSIAYTSGSVAIYVGAGGGASSQNGANFWGGAGGGAGGSNTNNSCGDMGGANGTFTGATGSTNQTGGGGAGDNGGTTDKKCPGAGGASGASGVVLATNTEATNGSAGAPPETSLYDYTTSCGGHSGAGGLGNDISTDSGGDGCVVIRCE